MNKTERSATLVPAVGAQVERGVGRLPSEGTNVGSLYRVPCVKVPHGFYGLHWVPVIGPKHRDLELNVTWEHIPQRKCRRDSQPARQGDKQ